MADGDPRRWSAWMSHRRLILIAGLLASAGIACGVWVFASADKGADPGTVPARQWRTAAEPTLNMWPTTGDRRGDRGLLRRAAEAWRRPDKGQSGPAGEITVLFAGEIEGRRVVVMRDGGDDFDSRRGLARYVENGEGGHYLAAVRTDDGGGFAPQAIGLVRSGRGARYLLPPWLTNVRAAELSSAQPRPRPLKVSDGVTDPIPLSDEHASPCHGTIALQATERRTSGSADRTFVSSTAGRDPEVAYNPDVSLISDHVPDGVAEPVSTPRQWQAVKDAACHEASVMFSATHINIWQVWQGRLPHGGGDAAADVVEVQSDEHGTATFGLFNVAGEQAGHVTGARYAGDGAPAGPIAVVAAQWQAPSGRRYCAAVGNERIDRIRIAGRPPARERQGRLLVVPAPGDAAPMFAITGYDAEHHAIATTLI
jgi:hypothetical protein